MIEAERFDHNLTLQFGLLSYQCKDEKDFIKKPGKLIQELLKCPDREIDDVFFGEPPSKKDFHAALKRISDNISKLK
ncbi:hypothetical protein BH11BAC7_BH11BAC7_22290 [soil metagenome]